MLAGLVGFALLSAPFADAREALAAVRDQYQKLESFSMTLEHQDSSGLFPGSYRQTLRWRKGDRFELVVSRPARRLRRGAMPAPNYFADGLRVNLITASGERRTDPLTADPNTMPGWEVAGGPILSWLQRTTNGKLYLDPPRSLGLLMSFADRKRWRGEAVVEITQTSGAGPDRIRISYFVAPDLTRLVGMEAKGPGANGWVHYRDQQFNPDLPATLGDPPK